MPLDGVQLCMERDKRAVSPVIGTILMVAVVVALGAVVGMMALGIGSENTDGGGPNYYSTQVDGVVEIGTYCASGPDEMVMVNHGGGDSVPVEDLELKIELDGEQARLTNFPIDSSSPGLDSKHVEGNEDLIYSSTNCMRGEMRTTTGDDPWDVTETLGFQIPSSQVDGTQIAEITVIDTQQEAQIAQTSVTLRED